MCNKGIVLMLHMCISTYTCIFLPGTAFWRFFIFLYFLNFHKWHHRHWGVFFVCLLFVFFACNHSLQWAPSKWKWRLQHSQKQLLVAFHYIVIALCASLLHKTIKLALLLLYGTDWKVCQFKLVMSRSCMYPPNSYLYLNQLVV